MSLKMFISYRHADHSDFTDRVADHFSNHLGEDNVFIDYRSIPYSSDWETVIEQEVLNCDVLVVIIGSNWLDILNAKQGAGDKDYVLFEIETAIKHNKHIAPVCIKGASPPPKDDLPASIHHMLTYNIAFMDRRNFDENYKKLITDIAKVLEVKIPPIKPFIFCPPKPERPTNFVGRTQEFEALFEKFTSEEVVAITAVRGMGGIGKTTFAQEMCYQPNFPFESVFWARITPNPQASTHLEAWARFADENYTLPPELTPEKLEQEAYRIRAMLTAHMQKKCGDAVVVFDDVWENGIDTIKLLRRALPEQTRVLITTRSDKVVNGLNAQNSKINLNELSDKDAEKLLRQLINNDDVTDNHVQRTVDILKGHPLALEIASESLNDALDADDINDILDDYEQGVKKGTRFDGMDLGIEASRSLNAVFQRTYDRLGDTLQTQYRAFGVIAPDSAFDWEILGAVWGIDGDGNEQRKAVNKVIKEFRGRALVKNDPATTNDYDGTWFNQHALLRTYARALLVQVGEERTTYYRYLTYAIKEAEQFKILPLEDWSHLDLFLPHLHEVGDKLVRLYKGNSDDETLNQVALQFALNIREYLFHRPENLFVDGQLIRHTWLEIGLQASVMLRGESWQGLFAGALGLVFDRSGDKHQALNYYRKSLTLRHSINDKYNEAIILNNIGTVYLQLGDMTEALDYFQRALPVRQQVGDKAGTAQTLNNIGSVYQSLGNISEALKYFQRALPITQQVGDKTVITQTLNNIGAIYKSLGEMSQALDYFQDVLPITQQVGDKTGEAITLNNIGSVYQSLGNISEALKYFQRALPIRRQVGDKSGEATTFNNIGLIYNALGDKSKALEYFQHALSVRKQVGDRSGEATTLNNIGTVYQSLGNISEALDYFQLALPICHQIGNKSGEATTLNNIGGIYLERGGFEKGLIYFKQALQIRQQIEDKFGEVETYFNIGMNYASQGKFNEAIPYIQRVIDLGSQVGHPHVPMFQQQLAQIQQMAGQQQVINIYKTQGEEAVKALLREWGNDADAIEGALAQLRQMED